MYNVCRHHGKQHFTLVLAVGMLLFLAHGQLAAQSIDTKELKEKAPSPTVKYKGVDPDTITRSNAQYLRIADVGVPTVARTSDGTIQGRGRVRRTELSIFVSVRNSGPATERYQIVTEVLGAAATNRSAQMTLLPGKYSRQNIQFLTEFSLPAGSSQLPIAVVLLDGNGVEIDRVDRQADMSRALGSLHARPAATVARDLAVTDLNVLYRRGRLDIGPVNVARERKIQTAVTVRNAGSERWGYPASLTVSYQMGRPGSLRTLTGPAGLTQPQTFALPPGERTVVTYDAPNTLTLGYYYTATAQVTSRDDQLRGNNSRQFVFFLETDGRIIPVEGE